MGGKTNDMSEEQARSTKQRKLRASCDECGNVKLKCDRGQPECGRCISHGMKCVYSVSRKLGKPPKNKSMQPSSSDGGEADPALPQRPPSSDTPRGEESEEPRDGGVSGASRNVATSSGGSEDHETTSHGATTRAMVTSPHRLEVDIFPGLADLSNITWRQDGAADNADSFDMNMGFGTNRGAAEESMQQPSLFTLTPPELDDLGFEELSRAILQAEPDIYPRVDIMPSMPSSRSGASSTGTGQAGLGDMQSQNGEHNCAFAAHKILEKLSPNNMSSTSTPSSGYATSGSSVIISSSSRPAPGDAQSRSVTLDHVLHLNREAIDSLNSLLNCNCKRSASLILLYSSIVSRILAWYQHAVDSLTAIRHPSVPSGRTSASTSFSIWNKEYPAPDADQVSLHYANSITTDRFKMTSSDSCNNYNRDGRIVVAPTKVAAGAFDVDDLVVQAALNIHLLSGEMRRVGRLIDRFITPDLSLSVYHPEGAAGNAGFGGPDRGIDDLTRSLDQWLKGEHSRLTNVIKMKIHELNT